MELSDRQLENLTELINVGIGKAAAILSSMLSQKISITVPKVSIATMGELSNQLQAKFGVEQLVGVSLGFDGICAGTTSLIFNCRDGKTLVDQLLASQEDDDDWDDDDEWDDDDDWDDDDEWDDDTSETDKGEFTDTDKAAIVELGNVMINGLMGSISTLLETVFQYQPPTLNPSMDISEIYGEANQESGDDNQFAMIMQTDFNAEENDISGYLILIFEIHQTIEGLVSALDNLSAEDDEEDDF